MLKTLGITQSQFADDIGIKQGSVSDIIRGKTAG
jgi:plasmid maintenance system antidote protein VapI